MMNFFTLSEECVGGVVDGGLEREIRKQSLNSSQVNYIHLCANPSGKGINISHLQANQQGRLDFQLWLATSLGEFKTLCDAEAVIP